MKQFGKTDDGVIGSLVRAYVSRPANPQQACPEFDPDQANAYIERSLTARSRSDYETHLSECAACRKNVVALVRLAGTEAGAAPAFAGSVPARESWLSGVRRGFGALTRPQWALAATAMLVLAISVPVFLLRNEADNKTPASRAAAAPPAEIQQQSSDVASTPTAEPKALASDSATPTTRKRQEIDALAGASPEAPHVAQPSVSETATDRIAKKTDNKSAESETSDEKQKRAEGQPGAAPAAVGGVGPASQVAKNEAEVTRQREKDSAQQPREAGRVDEPADKERTAKVAKPEEAAAPPPSSPVTSTDVAGGRSGFRRAPSRLALRDSSGEAVRSTGRKISKKEFWFRNNTWTDKDFDPNKDLPIVTIIRDSNVYLEEITKRPGLKPYLTGFSETERAIIVYKGKVYKLIPQGGEK